jgi:hypothetical protein
MIFDVFSMEETLAQEPKQVNNNLFKVLLDALSPKIRPRDGADVTEAFGIFSGDILIMNALRYGLQDLRDNPWQLTLVFASLLNDPLTAEAYGQKEAQKAIDWFLKTSVPVILDATLTNSPAMPCVIVGLQDSNEAQATLADLHYVPHQTVESEWEPLTQKFSAVYDPSTGLVIPSVPVIVNNQMVLTDRNGSTFPVLDTQIDINGNENFLITKNAPNADFSQCVLKWATNRVSVQLESLVFSETYNIVCNTKGEPSYTLYLYSIIKYILLRYKKTLLEGRGFENTTIKCSRLMPNNTLGPAGSENIWTRVITITGLVRESWATTTSERITQASYNNAGPDGLLVSQKDFLPSGFRSDPAQSDPSYLAGLGDGIGVKL